MDYTHKFDGRAADYAAARPSYAEGLFDCLFERYGLAARIPVADVGAGTGLFTEQLLKRGCIVYAVEPNEDMRHEAESRLSMYGGFISIAGDAARTGLADHSVHMVTAAQAFHWFDGEAFRRECGRILVRDGKAVIVYNRNGCSPLQDEMVAVAKRFCQDFVGGSGGVKENDVRIADFFCGSYETLRFINDREESEQIFVRRALSASYAPTESVIQKKYVDAVRDVFWRYCKAGKVLVRRTTWAYIGKID